MINIKKIYLIFMLCFTTLLMVDCSTSVYALEGGTIDEKITILNLETNLLNKQVYIEVDTNKRLLTVNFEHVYNEKVEDTDFKFSRITSEDLTQKNNGYIFNLPENTIAFYIHGFTYIKNNTSYKASAVETNNYYGDLTNINRIRVAEVISDKFEVKAFQSQLYFYFNFDKDMDYLKSIEIDYITYFALVIGLPFLNVELKKFGHQQVTEKIESKLELSNENIKSGWQYLEELKGGEYRYRAVINSSYYFDISSPIGITTKNIENLSIIKCEYFYQGNFYVDDVIHDPITPDTPTKTFLYDAFLALGFPDWLAEILSDINTIIMIFVVMVCIVGVLWALFFFRSFFMVFKILFMIIRFILFLIFLPFKILIVILKTIKLILKIIGIGVYNETSRRRL